MSTSAWGVDHGSVSKADSRKFTTNEKLTGAATAATFNTPIGAVAAGAQAKKGKRAKVGVRALGRGFAEGMGGLGAGAAVGGLATRSMTGAQIGAGIGSAAGTAHGTMASMRNSRHKGWMKKY